MIAVPFAFLVGKRGAMIRDVGTAGRQEIAKFLGRPVHLRLNVRVEEDWTNSRAEIARLHSSLKTTMIYTHCVPVRTVKEPKSPLDF